MIFDENLIEIRMTDHIIKILEITQIEILLCNHTNESLL